MDIAAPGVAILSTVPRSSGGLAIMEVDGMVVEGSYMQNSPIPDSSTGVSGSLVICPDLGKVACEAFGNHICLFER